MLSQRPIKSLKTLNAYLFNVRDDDASEFIYTFLLHVHVYYMKIISREHWRLDYFRRKRTGKSEKCSDQSRFGNFLTHFISPRGFFNPLVEQPPATITIVE